MYRSTAAMIEGWTKNLALLFDNSLALAVWRGARYSAAGWMPVLAIWLWNARFAAHSLQWLGAGWVLALLWVRTLVRFYARVAKSNFPFVDCALAPLGLPLFVVLLYRSWFQHRILKRVSWKGRELCLRLILLRSQASKARPFDLALGKMKLRRGATAMRRMMKLCLGLCI
jgi:hypothetical protein